MFENEYDFYLADTAAGKSIHYNLRYQVYCLRERYEDPSCHPQFLEQDEYDKASAHFIARYRNTGEWLGAMRLIVGTVQNLPVTKLSQINLERFCPEYRKRFAEASRLCTLLPASSHSNFTLNQPINSMRRLMPCPPVAKPLQASWISLGLIRAARQYCLRHDITYCFFLISDPLARMLRRLGMDIEPVGSPCQHRGWRRPYIHNVKSGYQAMSVRSPDLYSSFCRTDAYAHYSELVADRHRARIAAIG
jgi:N-acyl amino acid synthase of PEP-CTERM/exosortase system